jgi:urease beta subunit
VNTADRPIQIGSHYHFVESNAYLSFCRRTAYGRRLNIASGTAVRFEPGEKKTVSLVPISGNKVIRGGNNLVDGPITSEGNPPAAFMEKIKALGFLDSPEKFEREAKVRAQNLIPTPTLPDPFTHRTLVFVVFVIFVVVAAIDNQQVHLREDLRSDSWGQDPPRGHFSCCRG